MSDNDVPVRSISVPDDAYLRRIGLAAYLVSALEGLLIFDLPQWENAVPAELSVDQLAGKTTHAVGKLLIKHAPRCTDENLSAYLATGGQALLEISDERNAMLHARPATDEGRQQRLYRWRPPDTYFISDEWLDDFARRIDTLKLEVMMLRPPPPRRGKAT